MPNQAEAIQHQMQLRATERLLKSGDWLSAEDVAQLGLRSSRNTKALAHSWAKKGLLFAIRQEGSPLYPAYALDPETGYRPSELQGHLGCVQWRHPRWVGHGILV